LSKFVWRNALLVFVSWKKREREDVCVGLLEVSRVGEKLERKLQGGSSLASVVKKSILNLGELSVRDTRAGTHLQLFDAQLGLAMELDQIKYECLKAQGQGTWL
jgi:hypothetical protein